MPITPTNIKLICSDIDGTLLQYGKKTLEAEILSQIKALSARGILPAERDPRRTALALWSFLEGVVGLWLFDPDLFDLDREGPELLYPLVFRFCRPGGPEPFLP